MPSGWYSKSYAWLPYSLYYHHIYKYTEYVDGIDPKAWTKTFYGTNSSVTTDDDIDDNIDTNPFDDWIAREDEAELLYMDENQHMLRRAVE